MEIKVIFDKNTDNNKLHIGWGISLLINNKILFDTGEDGEWLLKNMESMNIDINGIESIIISHNHWDHTGGLTALLTARTKQVPVYICPGFSAELKELITQKGGTPVETQQWQEIKKNIYTTGEIPGIYKNAHLLEQSLVLRTPNGLSVITGCAHPGILDILSLVKEHFKEENIFLVIGGFHLLEEDTRIIDFIVREFKMMGVERVAPTHCSGSKTESIFAKEYRERSLTIKTGETIKI